LSVGSNDEETENVISGLVLLTGVKASDATYIINNVPIIIGENVSLSNAKTLKRFLELRGAKISIDYNNS